MFQFHVIPPASVPWDRLDAFKDRTLFQTGPWLDFLRVSQGVEPIVVEILQDGEEVGYFTGAIFSRMGIRILGSSFPGWTTAQMGFNLRDGVRRDLLAQAFIEFALSRLGCWHVEIYDAALRIEDVTPKWPNARFRIVHGFLVDLRGTETEVLQRMNENRRRCIRKAQHAGLIVEAATDEAFEDDYYDQLKDVFAHQGLVPTYPKARVTHLVQSLLPTGNLLLVRVRRPDTGACIGSGIFPAFNGTMYFWGGAAYRTELSHHPNESMHWFAMRYWKARGMISYDMMGAGDYKQRYGGMPIESSWIRVSKIELLMTLRDHAQNLTGWWQRLKGRFATPHAPGVS
jgi:hypothetical protein